MAEATEPIKISLQNEGGYAAAYGTSGETYMGIDRKQHPKWTGWPLIDVYKRSVGPVGEKKVIKDDRLFKLVFDFYYTKFWPSSQAGKLTNQQLANMYFDFYFHKPSIAQAALMKAANKTNFQEAIKVANVYPASVYENLFKLRILHYSNKWMNGKTSTYVKSKAGVLARAKRFAATINTQNFVSVSA